MRGTTVYIRVNNAGSLIKRILTVIFILLSVPAFTQLPLLRETVWLQSSRNIYIPGEEIKVSASVFENDTYTPSVLSNNLRLELINNSGEIIFQNNYELSKSQITIGIKLPYNLATGWYHLRAYTNWMRNFPESDFVWMPIKVAQPGDLDREEYRFLNDSIKIILTENGFSNSVLDTNECIIYTSDINGRPLSSEGFILSSPVDTVAWILTDATGWGISKYNKTTQESYKPFVKGHVPSKTLLVVKEAENDKPLIRISEDSSFVYIHVDRLQLTGMYKLLVHRIYNWYWYRESHIVSGNMEFEVPKSSLPGGIVQFSLLDNNNDLLAKRLWSDYNFNETTAKIFNYSEHSKIRNKCSADYQLNISSQNIENNINVLVMQDNPCFLLDNYLPGLPGWMAGYDIPAREIPFKAWLITNSYPEETVKAFLKSGKHPDNPSSSPSETPFTYYPETRNGILSGRLTNTNDSTGVEKVNLGLTILNDRSFHSAITDNEGYFVFSFPKINGPKDYIINYISEANPGWKIKIDRLYENVNHIPFTGPLKFTDKEREYLKDRSEIMRLQNLYDTLNAKVNETISAHDSTVVAEPFYGKADLRILVDDYIRLPNLREVIYEVVPHVSIRKRNGYTIPLITGDLLYVSSYPSLIIFDGIPVYDLTEILELPPARIKTIEVINQFYIYGNDVFSGIMNIESVNRDFGGLDLPETLILGTIEFPLKSGTNLLAPNYPQNKSIPVLDDVLLWRSTIMDQNGSISFTTGDNTGRHRIIVYGYDQKGNWVWSSEIFNVETGEGK